MKSWATLTCRASATAPRFDVEPLESRVLFSTWIDTSSRATVAQFYLNQYMASQGVDPLWTGSIATGDPGTAFADFKTSVFNRVNYFRSMVGIPNVTTVDDTFSQRAQAAAMMMSANGDITHTPPQAWQYYTDERAQTAGTCNLAKAAYGPAAIDQYMDDS